MIIYGVCGTNQLFRKLVNIRRPVAWCVWNTRIKESTNLKLRYTFETYFLREKREKIAEIFLI